MKVLLINGSPKERGCTYTALAEIAAQLEKEGIETEIFHIGTEVVKGCMGCAYCRKNGKCVVDDTVNIAAQKAKTADGFIFGSPVHYAAASGAMTSFLDRLFYSAAAALEYKPGAAVFSCRRGGATAAFDQLNKYFTINSMPVVSSQYWNMVHGNTPQQVVQDEEGMQIMRTLGRNMSWLLKSIDAGQKNGLELPEKEPKATTNFIR